VRTLVEDVQAPGRRTAVWNGRDDRGIPAASGVYFCRMRTPGYAGVLKMLLLK
jgi:hypothetical protein